MSSLPLPDCSRWGSCDGTEVARRGEGDSAQPRARDQLLDVAAKYRKLAEGPVSSGAVRNLVHQSAPAGYSSHKHTDSKSVGWRD